MRKLQSSLLLPLVLTMAACGHYSDDLASLERKFPGQQIASAPHDIAPAAGGIAQGTLAQNLAREYTELARYENDTAFDYKSSGDYTKKAKLAMAGKIAAPSRIEKYDIPAQYAGELIAARKTLVDALKTQNTPENAASLARAQTRFDCWVERAEEAVDDAHFADCKAEYEAAMASLTMPAAGGVIGAAGATYDIGFAANSTLIADMSRKDLDYIAALMNDPANAAYRLVLTGYKNAAVSGAYADRLTQERLAAAKSAIMGRGVQEARIATALAEAPAESGKVVVTVAAPSATPASAVRTFVPVTPVTVSQ